MWRAPSILVAIVLVLLALGVVMLASASGAKGDKYDDPAHFLKKQLIWLVVAAVAGVASAVFIDYHWWRKLAIPLVVLSVVALSLVFIPHIGRRIGGANRWVQIGPLTGQPSELAKFAAVVMIAAWMSRAGRRADRLVDGLILPLAGLAVLLGLIFLEPDYGTTFLVALTGMAVMFAGGSKLWHLLVAGGGGFAAFMVAIMHNEERMRRLMAFMTPAAYPDETYQLRQSMDAFVLGGGWGVGLGQSLQKHSYLPEAHTDFILAIMGEELGIVATILVVILFIGFFICGMSISMNASDVFGRLLGFGLTTLLTLQAAINVGVVTGCVPTKGLPLPFISAGGSNLVLAMLSVGVLINIARHSTGEISDEETRVVKDRLHWA